jgi:crotonobetainyl-CoA:carnitine CoA-transferase CaiB-like acyl-CoA transferase
MDILALSGIAERDVWPRRVEIADKIAARFLERTNAEWVGIFTRHAIWHAPVNGYAEVADDPQVRHNNSFMTVPGAGGSPVTLVSHPVMYDGAAPEVRFPPQVLGAQTREVLGAIGYTDREIDRLAASGVVGIPRVESERNAAAPR